MQLTKPIPKDERLVTQLAVRDGELTSEQREIASKGRGDVVLAGGYGSRCFTQALLTVAVRKDCRV